MAIKRFHNNPPPKPEHKRIRQQDEVFCPRCTKRWKVGEDEPECAGLSKGMMVVK